MTEIKEQFSSSSRTYKKVIFLMTKIVNTIRNNFTFMLDATVVPFL